MSHLFGNNKSLQTIFDVVAPLAIGAATTFIAPELLPAEAATFLGSAGTGALAGGLGGAVGGATQGLLTTGKPLLPALEGGAGGAVLGGLGGALGGGAAGDAGGLSTAAQGDLLADPSSSFGSLAPGSLAGGSGGAFAGIGGDLTGGGAFSPAPVTPFTQAAEGIPTFGGGGGDIASAAGAPQATLASIGGPAAGGGAGPGATAGATSAFAPPAALGGGGPGALDFTAATQGTPGSLFSGASDTATSLSPGASGGLPAVGDTAAQGAALADPGSSFGALPSGSLQGANLDISSFADNNNSTLLGRIGGEIKDFAGRTGTAIKNDLSDPFKDAGLALTAGGLLKSLAAPQQIPGIPQLTGLANQTGAQGQSLIGQGLAGRTAPTAGATNLAGSAVSQGQELAAHLENGTLPPGLQATVDQATNAAIQKIKSDYAKNGLTGSSMETQDINSVRSRAVSQASQIALTLNQQGLSFETLGSNLYQALIGQSNNLLQVGANLTGQSGQQLNSLVATNVAQNNQVNAAVGNLGRALAGGSLTNTNTATP